MLKLYKALALGGLLLWPAMARSAEAPWEECPVSLSRNCSCVGPILVRRLGAAKATAVIQAWVHSFEKDPVRRETFFREHAGELASALYAYGLIKNDIGMQCGTLDFDGDYGLSR